MAQGGRRLSRRRFVTLTIATTLAVSLLPSEGARAADLGRSTIVWSDVDRSFQWAKKAIDDVGATNAWMRDFAVNADGTYPFQPSTIETRKYFARAVVMALAPNEVVDPSITFADLDPSDTF